MPALSRTLAGLTFHWGCGQSFNDLELGGCGRRNSVEDEMVMGVYGPSGGDFLDVFLMSWKESKVIGSCFGV